MSSLPTTYRTRNWSSYNTALKHRGSLSIWFDAEREWHASATRKHRCQREFSDAAIQVCLTMKVLFGMPLRQTTSFVESLLRLAGLDWKVPDFSTLCCCQSTLNVAIPYRAGPLHLLIDATGIKAKGEGGVERPQAWRKQEAPLAQAASGHGRGNVGDPCSRGYDK